MVRQRLDHVGTHSISNSREKRKLARCLELLFCGMLLIITNDSGTIVMNTDQKAPAVIVAEPKYSLDDDLDVNVMKTSGIAESNVINYCLIMNPTIYYWRLFDNIYHTPIPNQHLSLTKRNENNVTLRELLRGETFGDSEHDADPTRNRCIALDDLESYFIDIILYEIAVYKDAIIEHFSNGIPDYYKFIYYDAILSAASP